ncbi:MAG: twin-arginine translocase TatA/TatE family subunit [Chloroflexota bacterium]|nr:twin-arginine translocase TatA/TatE family subunit [Chloroflexota bacterium]
MGPIGWPELIILLVVVLIIFGPGKLPDIGNAIGRGVREFRKASSDLEDSIRGDVKPAQPGNGGSTGSTSSTPGGTGPSDTK